VIRCADVPSEPIFDGRLVACKEVRRDACFVVVAAYFPRLFKQPTRCGSITFDRHPGRAEGDYGVVGVYGHERVVTQPPSAAATFVMWRVAMLAQLRPVPPPSPRGNRRRRSPSRHSWPHPSTEADDRIGSVPRPLAVDRASALDVASAVEPPARRSGRTYRHSYRRSCT
jgi:hypothetical protein